MLGAASLILVSLIAQLEGGPAPRRQVNNVPHDLLEKIRGSARAYVDELGRLTCTEDTRQTVRTAGVIWTERREDGCDTTEYKLFAVQAVGIAGPKVNVKRASADWPERLREASLGTATGFLASLADPNIDADLRWVQMATLKGRTVSAVSFHMPAADGYLLADSKRTVRVPYTGLVYADPETGAFVRVRIWCVDIPRDMEYEGAEVAIDFKVFLINGRLVDLPSHSVVRFRMEHGDATNEADYNGYRLADFSTDSAIQFDNSAVK